MYAADHQGQRRWMAAIWINNRGIQQDYFQNIFIWLDKRLQFFNEQRAEASRYMNSLLEFSKFFVFSAFIPEYSRICKPIERKNVDNKKNEHKKYIRIKFYCIFKI